MSPTKKKKEGKKYELQNRTKEKGLPWMINGNHIDNTYVTGLKVDRNKK